MAIGWIAAFKAVPWSEVREIAPYVVQGANKLWSAVRKNPPAPDDGVSVEQKLTVHDATLSDLDVQMRRLAALADELRTQQVASSELIQLLASQNAQLVEAVEVLRLRSRALLIGVAASCAGLVGMLVWQLVR